MLKTNIVKNWYIEEYPDDTKGKQINPLVTFENIWTAMHSGSIGLYTLLGIIDKQIRDRIFEEMVQRKYCHCTDYLMTLFLFGTQQEV